MLDCQRGVAVQYDQYDLFAHIETAVPRIASAMPWRAIVQMASIGRADAVSSLARGLCHTRVGRRFRTRVHG